MTPRPLTPPATVFAWSATAFGAAPAALFALDAALADVVRSTRTPMVGQMRLTWWHDALHALDAAAAPAQPVLRALAAHVVPRVPGAVLARMIEGWDVLIEEERLDAAALERFAEGRGARLFAALATVLQAADDPAIGAAGRGWALADLASHVEAGADAIAAEARRSLAEAEIMRWRGAARPIGALARDAALALAGKGESGGPRRAAGVLRRVVTGR
ncbi:squalene/phytoene synthase family protein [Sphingomonas corticis]|jgi:phytoene synthase|uniref:Squalene/phytoene synthase family protein n=1 Tax=Sphingomonas corticis TaxID=2722791 RepID=A0ABX1CRV5_9SPHN|nr:squalene/phytoene synthase family protein [Sphingomonas corticis]NJR79045.1 squalene/phytoene synthase family protein [Sphingomonas corticis]